MLSSTGTTVHACHPRGPFPFYLHNRGPELSSPNLLTPTLDGLLRQRDLSVPGGDVSLDEILVNDGLKPPAGSGIETGPFCLSVGILETLRVPCVVRGGT